jgi:tryptophan-rich sensory protein
MNQAYSWYSQLIKPVFAPPSWVFGPVWTVLYILIAISYGYAGYLFFTKKIPFIVLLPFILNLIFNLIFTPIQFGLQNNYLAAVDITLVVGTLVWALVAIFPYTKWVAYINIPYLFWGLFATAVQFTVTWLNR